MSFPATLNRFDKGLRLQILLGGGQEAMNVTTTSLRQGKFETRFWHKVLEEEVGRVKGHFGPINTCVCCLISTVPSVG
jgi:hypothetical protein